MTKQKILELLKQSEGYLSGEKLSACLGITRAAVWKGVKALREDGYEIEAVTHKGYRLVSRADRLLEYEIQSRLVPGVIGSKIVVFKTLDSTNQYAKSVAELPDYNGCVILAEQQLTGKAKNNKGFYSPEQSGIYMSLILKPDCTLEQFSVFQKQVVDSVREAILKVTGAETEYRVPNELYYEGKKLCGILHELSLEGETGRIQWIIAGIGLYVNNIDFPNEIPGISLLQIAGKALDRTEVVCLILNCLQKRLASFLS